MATICNTRPAQHALISSIWYKVSNYIPFCKGVRGLITYIIVCYSQKTNNRTVVKLIVSRVYTFSGLISPWYIFRSWDSSSTNHSSDTSLIYLPSDLLSMVVMYVIHGHVFELDKNKMSQKMSAN